MIEKEKFRMYRDEDEISRDKGKSRTITIRLNTDEQKILEELKSLFNLNMDGTALKVSMEVGYNVLLGFLGTKTMRYLTSGTRRRELQD